MTASHPARTDSPAYLAARKVLMNTRKGGCVICGGLSDLSHPELATVENPKGLEDHHGGGIYVKDLLVALNVFPLEWSQGWGASPERVSSLVGNLNVVLGALGEPTYDAPITDIDTVMSYVDSPFNANVKFCKQHHLGTQTQHTPDANGHEAVGVHEIPGPIFWGQMTDDWVRFSMWGASTGTVAVAPVPDRPGCVQVIHAHPSENVQRGDILPPTHPHSRLAHAGAHVDPGGLFVPSTTP